MHSFILFFNMPFLLQKKNTQPKGASGCNIQLVQSSLGTRRGQNKIIIFIYSIETKITCACCVNICVYLSYDCNDIDVMPVETCFWFVLLSGSKSAKVAYKGCYINLVTDAVTSFFKNLLLKSPCLSRIECCNWRYSLFNAILH